MIQRITGEVISAESFDCQDRTLPQQLRSMRYRFAVQDLVSMSIQQANSRAALRASIRLSMKAAIGRVMEFARAIAAHLKMSHSRALAIVGNVLDDGKSGTAIRAVDKRITVAAVAGIEEFFKTVLAGAHVRRSKNLPHVD